jgi:hypothetical protein
MRYPDNFIADAAAAISREVEWLLLLLLLRREGLARRAFGCMAAVNEVFFCWPFAAKTENCTPLARWTGLIAFLLPIPACEFPCLLATHKI